MTNLLMPLDYIVNNPWQTRQIQDQEYIISLANDIAANGLLQTPIGRQFEGDKIQLAFGHNRLAAFKWLTDQGIPGYAAMPIDVLELTDEQMADMAWSENEARRDHTPMDRALAIQKRIQDFGWTQDQVAAHLHISRPVITNALRLLKLPDDIQTKIAAGGITERQALALLPLYDLPQELREVAENAHQYSHAAKFKPSVILKSASDGASSEDIRGMVKELMDEHSKDLQKAPWKLDYDFSHSAGAEDIVSATCKDCRLRLNHNGNRCPSIRCFGIKTRLWKADQLDMASQASGIKILENDIDSNHITEFTYSYMVERSKQVIATHCENLRLTWDNYAHLRADQEIDRVEGFANVKIVCMKRSGFCACMNGLKALEERGSGTYENANDLAEAARQARIEERKAKKRMDEFRKQATEKIAKALKDNQVGAWRLILGKLTYGNLSSKESDLEKIIQRVAGILVGEPYSGEKGLSYLGRVHDTLKFAGLPGIDETEPETKIIDRCICGHTLEEHNPTTGCSECVCEIFEIATTEVVDIPVL